MALANYDDLKAAVASFLDRDDLTSAIVDFISLAEGQAILDLRLRAAQSVATGTCTISQDYIALPATCLVPRSFRLDLDPVRVVEIVAPDVWLWHRENYEGEIPAVALAQGERLYLAPTPVAAHPYTLWFDGKALDLATTGTNWLMTNFPGIYLYGTLLQAAGGYLANDERGIAWKALYDAQVSEVSRNEWRAKAGGGPLTMRPERWA